MGTVYDDELELGSCLSLCDSSRCACRHTANALFDPVTSATIVQSAIE